MAWHTCQFTGASWLAPATGTRKLVSVYDPLVSGGDWPKIDVTLITVLSLNSIIQFVVQEILSQAVELDSFRYRTESSGLGVSAEIIQFLKMLSKTECIHLRESN